MANDNIGNAVVQATQNYSAYVSGGDSSRGNIAFEDSIIGKMDAAMFKEMNEDPTTNGGDPTGGANATDPNQRSALADMALLNKQSTNLNQDLGVIQKVQSDSNKVSQKMQQL